MSARHRRMPDPQDEVEVVVAEAFAEDGEAALVDGIWLNADADFGGLPRPDSELFDLDA